MTVEKTCFRYSEIPLRYTFYEEIINSLNHDEKIPNSCFQHWADSFDVNLLQEVR